MFIQYSASSSSSPLLTRLPGPVLFPEVDEAVGGLRDGREGPDGGVADPDG